MFLNHKEWIVTIGSGYAKITASNYEEVRKTAFTKFGQDKCGMFYPANTTAEQQEAWKDKTGYPLQTAEEIIRKRNLKE